MTSRKAGNATKMEVGLPALSFWVILRRCGQRTISMLRELGWIDPTTANDLGPESYAENALFNSSNGSGMWQ